MVLNFIHKFKNMHILWVLTIDMMICEVFTVTFGQLNASNT